MRFSKNKKGLPPEIQKSLCGVRLEPVGALAGTTATPILSMIVGAAS